MSQLMTKDLTIANECSKDSGLDLPFMRLALQDYADISLKGEGKSDFGVLYKIKSAKNTKTK